MLIPHLPLQIETAAFNSIVSQQGPDVPPAEGAMLAAERARELYGRAFHELVRQVLHSYVVGAVNESLLLGSCWSSRCQLHPMPAHLHTL